MERNPMKVIFDKEELLTALIPAASIAPGKNTIASIEGILFECPGDEQGECRITSYDMEKGLRTNIPAKIMSSGSFIINSQNMLQIIRSMPAGEITVDIDETNRAKITGGNSYFEINSIPGDNFPALPLLSGDRTYTLPQYVFRSLVLKTSFAIAQNSPKAFFNGVYFNIENGFLKCVGCDGSRLGYAEYELGEEGVEASFIVPGRILLETLKNIKDTEDDMQICLARKHVIFKVGEYVYFSRLIDGEYMNYKRVIPETYERSAYINTETFLKAAERALIVTEDKLGGSSSKTFIKLEFENNLLKISSASTGGSVYEEIPVSMDGSNLAIGFNCRYLVDALKVAEEYDTVCVKMNGSLMGICIEAADRGEETEEKRKDPVKFTLFVMPLRMNGK